MALSRPEIYTSVILVLLYILASTVRANECPNKTFPCFNDCCLRGEWFCHKKEERCKQCSYREQLCHTDSEPVECMLYCHNLRQQHQTCVKENPTLNDIVVIVIAIGGIAVGSSILTLFLRNVCLFKKADQCCVRLLRALLGEKVVQDTTGADDVDVQIGLLDQATSSSDSPLALGVTGSNETIRLEQEKELRLSRRDTDAVIDVPETVVVRETPEQAPATTEPMVSFPRGESSQATTLDSVAAPPSSAPPSSASKESRPMRLDSFTFHSSSQHQINEHQGAHSRPYTAVDTPHPAQSLSFSSMPATPDHAQHQRTIHTGTPWPLGRVNFVLDNTSNCQALDPTPTLNSLTPDNTPYSDNIEQAL